MTRRFDWGDVVAVFGSDLLGRFRTKVILRRGVFRLGLREFDQ